MGSLLVTVHLGSLGSFAQNRARTIVEAGVRKIFEWHEERSRGWFAEELYNAMGIQ
jgi:hypothetical protein